MKGVLIGCSIFGLVLVTAAGIGIWFFLFRVQPMADASLAIPPSAEIDQTIEMVVTTHNPHAESVIVDSIDISDSFLEGFQVTTVDPAENETMDVPFVDQRAWMFSHTLAPGETKTFTFTLNPVLVGHYSGDVDVCNPNQDFNTLLADVVVRATTAGAGAGTDADNNNETDSSADKSKSAAPSVEPTSKAGTPSAPEPALKADDNAPKKP